MNTTANVKNANLPEIDDTDFGNLICLEMFNKAISEYNPDNLTATKLFLETNDIEQNSPLFYIFTGFEMGMAAALDIVNKMAANKVENEAGAGD